MVLYFVQGVAIAYFTGFQKRYLLGHGIDPDRIAILSSLVLLPFILKPFIGLVADSLSVPRKLAIAVGLAVASGAFAMALGVNPAQEFYLFAALMITASLGVAIFDTVADALAVDAFADSEFGELQSRMLMGKSLGLILFSVIFGVVIDRGGYGQVFLFLAVAMLVPLAVWRSVGRVSRKERFEWRAFRAFTRRDVVSLAIYGVIYSIPSFGVSGLFAYYLSAMGANATQVGWLESVKSVGAIGGAMAFPWLLQRFGFARVAVIATLAAVGVSVLAPWYASFIYLGVVVALFGATWALRETVFTTLAMRLTDPAIAATMFSLLMAFSNLGTSLGEGWATAAAGRRGFEFAFVFFGLLNVASLWHFRRRDQKP
ncbi:MAG TPA: MFS transporter [Bdellovibrionota bacterium]|jgi:MFS family permease|nr:MFS transporter [Bdellovibrionota bacterium]